MYKIGKDVVEVSFGRNVSHDLPMARRYFDLGWSSFARDAHSLVSGFLESEVPSKWNALRDGETGRETIVSSRVRAICVVELFPITKNSFIHLYLEDQYCNCWRFGVENIGGNWVTSSIAPV